MRELYHSDLDTTVHPDIVYTINAVVSSSSNSDPNAVATPHPVTLGASDPDPNTVTTPCPVTPSPIDNNMYVVFNSVSKVTYDLLLTGEQMGDWMVVT